MRLTRYQVRFYWGGYTPTGNDKVTVKATVTYYNPDDVVFHDGFEGDNKSFTEGQESKEDSYSHSETMSQWGRKAATPVSGKKGPAKHTLDNQGTGTVTAWYYDTAETPSQLKYCFEVNQTGSSGNQCLGVAYDSTLLEKNPPASSDEKYVMRKGEPVNDYGFLITDVERTKGWHEFRWDVADSGTTAYIDGQPVYTSNSLKSIDFLQIMTNWNDNATNSAAISDKLFLDDITVVKPEAKTLTAEASAEITLRELVDYTLEGETRVYVDKSEISAQTVKMQPSVDPEMKIFLDDTELVKDKDYTVNTGSNEITFQADYLSSLPLGNHEFQLKVMNKTLTFTIVLIDKTAGRDYYFSTSGSDDNDGTKEKPYASLDKLNSLSLKPGDTVYLDANSVWIGQIKIKDSGLPGMPITITKYNDNGDRDARPIINAGPVVTKDNMTQSTLLKLSDGQNNGYGAGALEIRSAEYIEVSGLELTNDGGEADTDRINGRNGILVIADLPEDTTKATFDREWDASLKTDIHIDDCYVHDVNSSSGYKMAGGINFFGNITNILVENCTVINCDNEGIRNAGMHRGNGDWPAVHKVTFRNNYIEGCTGDGMVISNVKDSTISGNVVTNCGKPELSGSANYAALWLIGAEDTVVEHNEVFNNPYRCNDGEPFDFDHNCKNNVYQYNYTHDNAGGVLLSMNSVSGRNTFRYNISVDDGGYYNKHLFFYNSGAGKSTYIHNNVFVLNENLTQIFGNDSTEIQFWNNILMSVNGKTPKFATKKFTSGQIKNNIIYPETLLNGDLSGVDVADNKFVNPKIAGAGFKPGNDGQDSIMTGIATAEAKLDMAQLVAYKLLEDSPAIDAGISVDTGIAPVTEDIFGNPISGTPDIGVHEWNQDSPEEMIPEVKLERITIQAGKDAIEQKESMILDVETAPANAWNQAIVWESSDEEIAAVDENGVVRGVSAGTVTIKAASAVDETVYDEIELTVKELGEDVVVDFELQADKDRVKAGDEVQLSVIAVNTDGNEVEVDPDDVDVTYTTDISDVDCSVDENGLLTVAEDAEDGTITVNAQVVYQNKVYEESFETGNTLTGGENSLVRTKERAHDGNWSMKTMDVKADDDASKTFLEPQQGTVSVWFYDTANKTARKTISVSPDDPTTNLLAIGVFKDAGTDEYAYRFTSSTGWKKSGVERTTGWHEFKWEFSDDGLVMYIDDIKIAESAEYTEFKSINVNARGGWTQSEHDGNFGVDDICVLVNEKYDPESLEITVSSDEPTEEKDWYTTAIKVTEEPDKMVYGVGETFDPEGMKVVAVQKSTPSNASPSNASPSDATREVELDLSDLNFEADEFAEAGEKTVTIIYTGLGADLEEKEFKTTVTVTVKDGVLPEDTFYTTSIKIKEKPAKLEYEAGESFDPEGLKVTAMQKATPSNLTREIELDLDELEFEYDTDDFKTPGRKLIQVVYYGLDQYLEEKRFTSSFEVTVVKEEEPDRPHRPSSGGSSYSSSSVNASGNWSQETAGWRFVYTNGTYAVDKWERVNNYWYHFDQSGYMETGWRFINGSWYYLNPISGAMTTGWYFEPQDGNWYYLNSTGAMAIGWQKIDGVWYYFNTTVPEATWSFDEAAGAWGYTKKDTVPYGAMYKNTDTPDGYRVGENGAWIQ